MLPAAAQSRREGHERCAVPLAPGPEEQQKVHFRGARNLGISREKLEAMIGHVMHYAGWPTGATASRVLKEVWEQMDAEQNG